MMSGTESLSTTAKWLARYRACIRYRGPRYRGLVSESSDILISGGGKDFLSHCYECPPPQIELNGCGRKDEEDEADEEDEEDEADEADEEDEAVDDEEDEADEEDEDEAGEEDEDN